jgi:hypothetical protein
MERQRQEDELKSRSTRKGQDSDQKRVCYSVLYVVPSLMFSNFLCMVIFVNGYFLPFVFCRIIFEYIMSFHQ